MTATTNLTEIRCDGPPGLQACPDWAADSSTHGAESLRARLAEEGWEAIHTGDLILDRCSRCGNGTA
ncbi:hypothetical protein FHR83_006818 [Actinoplanes campanulatus]|uniref:Uncharacterized protein n=1 Tax=Actinoplanes campanulatus TaxID=113559 RepID=A0A7W5AN39_9ACTN|nr:hypothetical protein [Actinoplanes campanulatus]MBB3099112.1 hypothetical protein [Actinoplanes campanulatus]GGN38982.1 hypothetical protein GCM10010109_66410 [Actinoplanes campanulatus]GID40268.1 hypothetical protein Aca09nite_67740 [Actinoplanes campanulatus]